ncbi:MAG: recombinase family protein, partial [Cytophagales bacterium]|nr:recombinase family protein [Cytophagales bacterium]
MKITVWRTMMQAQTDQRIFESPLNRKAIIYVRQSTAHQVQMNNESLRMQLSLKELAISFGWNDPVLIDDDLGSSASGYTCRPGFQKMLTMVTMKQIGIIFCIDASRLSRNSKDWAHLFELCGFFNTLVADNDQVFDLNRPND